MDLDLAFMGAIELGKNIARGRLSVSYTHLTLPTILIV